MQQLGEVCLHQQVDATNIVAACRDCQNLYNTQNVIVYGPHQLKTNIVKSPQTILNDVLALKGQPYDFPHNPHYVMERSQIIQFLDKTHQGLQLSPNCLFVSINYFDTFAQKTAFAKQDTYLYAVTALILSAKFDDIDGNIPTFQRAKKAAQCAHHIEINYYTQAQYKQAEIQLIKILEWKLQTITLYEQVLSLISYGVVDADDTINCEAFGGTDRDNLKQYSVPKKLKEIPKENIDTIIHDIQNNFRDVCIRVIEDKIYFKQDQTLLALAVVGYLRKQVGIVNFWSQHLNQMTKISAQQISSIVSQLIVSLKKPVQVQSTTALRKQENLVFQKSPTQRQKTTTTFVNFGSSSIQKMNSLLTESFFVQPKRRLSFLNENFYNPQEVFKGFALKKSRNFY